MATIRKHRDKWQVQIRRVGMGPMSKSFTLRRDALEWARHAEREADRHELPSDPKALQRVKLGDLVRRYRDTVSPRKKTAATETIVLNAFLSRQICSKRLSELRTEDFAVYRDQRLQVIKPTSLKRELTPIRHLFEVARDEWGLPLKENPLDKLKLEAPDQRRERRLRGDEFSRLIEAANSRRKTQRAFLEMIGEALRELIGEQLPTTSTGPHWRTVEEELPWRTTITPLSL